ncbi:hypothetical protein [Hafnia psychrotolerans]|uniref:Uncharacterized protein n=1 Tax=Hafnia psychrotolerans TaxID=1477018 RepID=A0ABQ1H320_9GAMM|nr:hypothetical protein [Hafnia psychrotolerans]GGA55890.1 hypothetical protein GCM10011328_34160 [Hafnia psychrotolerans]
MNKFFKYVYDRPIILFLLPIFVVVGASVFYTLPILFPSSNYHDRHAINTETNTPSTYYPIYLKNGRALFICDNNVAYVDDLNNEKSSKKSLVIDSVTVKCASPTSYIIGDMKYNEDGLFLRSTFGIYDQISLKGENASFPARQLGDHKQLVLKSDQCVYFGDFENTSLINKDYFSKIAFTSKDCGQGEIPIKLYSNTFKFSDVGMNQPYINLYTEPTQN